MFVIYNFPYDLMFFIEYTQYIMNRIEMNFHCNSGNIVAFRHSKNGINIKGQKTRDSIF